MNDGLEAGNARLYPLRYNLLAGVKRVNTGDVGKADGVKIKVPAKIMD